MNENKNTKIIANAVGAHDCARDHRGITLIALIITIIVILILVGVSITIALKGGLFETTKRAAKGTEAEKNAEQELASGRVKIDGVWYDSIEDYAIGKKSDNQPPEEEKPPVTPPEDPVEDSDMDLTAYNNAEKDSNGVLLSNVTVTYRPDGRTAVVPKGFKIIDGIEGTQSIVDGLVIQDKDGNEFVWIPVEVKASDTETSIASFYRSEWANNARTTGLSADYTEPYASGYTGETAEYNAMVKSVYENKGFYIGRYEAGSVDEAGQPKERTNTANGTTEMVVKKNQYPYNYVGWGSSMSDYASDIVYRNNNQGKGAVRLSKEMYQNKDVGVTSTLCYGIQWDAMLDFIKDNNHDVTNSTSWGNYEPTSGDGVLKNTGSSDTYTAKNIYDVAGNVFEWTMEAYSSTNRIRQGGAFRGNSETNSASDREYVIPNACSDIIGFRIALYIK